MLELQIFRYAGKMEEFGLPLTVLLHPELSGPLSEST